jgi:hypothetical protein
MMEAAIGRDGVGLGAAIPSLEVVTFKTVWLVEKWSEEACDWMRAKGARGAVSSALLRKFVKAEDESEANGNLLLNEGIQTMLDLLIGAGGTVYSNANAQLGVGDSSTAEAATQTDLQASTNKLFKAMNASYPQRASQTMSWQSDFGSSEANYTWNEVSIRNSSGADKNLNRKVQNLGTKASGTWTLTAQVTIS